MRAGLMLPPQVPVEQIVPLAARAEELGYDVLACGEHVFFHGPVTNAFVALSAAAGATNRIRLLSAVTLLPTYPAALAAKMAATLHGFSGGRFELGVGVGGENPAELRACGIGPAERGARTNEALEIVSRLFTGKAVTYEGHFAHLDEVALDPAPTDGRLPLWVGGRKPASFRRAARFADVWMPYMVTPEHVADGLAAIRDHPEAAPDRAPIRGAVFCWAAVGDDGEATRQGANDTLGRIYRQDFSRLSHYVPAGTPAQVADRLTEYGQAGAETVLFAPACAADDLDRNIVEFAREVIPALTDVPTGKENGPSC